MLTLLTFAGSFEQPSHSPFCVKAMCLLQMSGQAWRPQYMMNPSKMPHGRLAALRRPSGLIADSANIQAWLEAQGARFHPGMSAVDKARSHALVRMVEESTRPGLVHERWLRDDCREFPRAAFFGEMPGLIRGPVTRQLRKRVRRAMSAQGIAQFSETERLDRMGRDLAAIEAMLDAGPFLFGAAPTAADAAVAPVLDMIRTLPCDTGLRRLMRGNAALMAYAGRVRAALYPG